MKDPRQGLVDIPLNENSRFYADGRSLEIRAPEFVDMGLYQCMANNTFGVTYSDTSFVTYGGEWHSLLPVWVYSGRTM